MKSFNLIDEGWLPCFYCDGSSKPTYLGLKDVLLNAGDLRELRDDSPCATAALLRLLLAILYDCFPWSRDTGDDEWEAMWNEKTFPSAEIVKYFEEHADCFDLFHKEKPFFQLPHLELFSLKLQKKQKIEVTETSPIARLMPEAASNNNPTLFDHSFNDEEKSYLPSTVARALVTAHSYALPGGNSTRYHRGKNTFPPANFKFQAAPLVSGATMWLVGTTLFETLMLNLLPGEFSEDKALWNLSRSELEAVMTDFAGETLRVGAPMEQFVFPARAIRLEPEDDLSVRRIFFTQGRRTDKKSDDPMKTYFIKTTKTGKILVPLGLDKNRALWRDAHALFKLQPRKSNPTNGRGIKSLYNATRSCVQIPVSLHIVGLVVESSARVVLWRHERLPVPLRLLQDVERVQHVGELVQEAETIAEELQKRIKTLCEILYAPDYGRKDSVRKKPEARHLQSLLQRFDTTDFYWAALGQRFEELLFRLDKLDEVKATCDWWCAEIEAAARCSLEDALDNLGSQRRDLLARRALAGMSFSFATKRTQARLKQEKEANKEASKENARAEKLKRRQNTS